MVTFWLLFPQKNILNITPYDGWYSSNSSDRILCKTNPFSVVSLLKMSTRKHNAVLFTIFHQVWCHQNSWEKFFVCKGAALCQVFLPFYQRGHRHLRFIFSSHVVDNSDADLIVRHFHLFILFQLFRNGIH